MWCDWSNSTAVVFHACCSSRQFVYSVASGMMYLTAGAVRIISSGESYRLSFASSDSGTIGAPFSVWSDSGGRALEGRREGGLPVDGRVDLVEGEEVDALDIESRVEQRVAHVEQQALGLVRATEQDVGDESLLLREEAHR